MDIKVHYSHASAIQNEYAASTPMVQGECFASDFGRIVVLLMPDDFVGVLQPSCPLSQMDHGQLSNLEEMIAKDLVHLLEVPTSDWVDETLLKFCKDQQICFVGPMFECCETETRDPAMRTCFFEPFDNVNGLIRNLKEGNFLVRTKTYLYCSSTHGQALLTSAFHLEANPVFGRKNEVSYMLRLMNSSPFPALMRLSEEVARTEANATFVLPPNGKQLINTGPTEQAKAESNNTSWQFDWLNVRLFGGDQVTAFLEAQPAR